MPDPEPDPLDRDATVVYGAPEPVAPGVRRIVARNPSPMTFTGTATYLVGAREIAVIDPGPDDPAHLAAILDAVPPRGRVAAILVTHTHRDHSPLARALARETGAPTCGFGRHGAGMEPAMAALAASGAALGGGEGADPAFSPDRRLDDGDAVEGAGWRLRAVRTPGHLPNHLSFALGDDALFSGDAVMGWATTLVSPPEGDMRAQMATLARVRAGGWRRLLPGHGKPVEDPARLLDWQIRHRRAREAQILAALAEGPADAPALAARLYAGLAPALLPAAARNVLAHLIALAEDGRAASEGPLAAGARFRLTR
jgi:glyoxylase-like metal-dependent hydrolase (beta-lactamase superfamily II)